MRRGGSASPRNALNAAAAAGYAFFFFLCLGFVYLLVQPRLPEVDLTSVRLNTLSGVSKNWLRQLQQEVRLTAFLTDRDQIESFRADVERIRELAPSVSYEILDPLNDSTRALEFLQGKGDSVFPGDIFVQSGERRRRLRMFKRLSEGDLLNAMVATTLTGPSTVYFLGGPWRIRDRRRQTEARFGGADSRRSADAPGTARLRGSDAEPWRFVGGRPPGCFVRGGHGLRAGL
jgi:hypothetical protein